jgi:hypothetical protein
VRARRRALCCHQQRCRWRRARTSLRQVTSSRKRADQPLRYALRLRSMSSTVVRAFQPPACWMQARRHTPGGAGGGWLLSRAAAARGEKRQNCHLAQRQVLKPHVTL